MRIDYSYRCGVDSTWSALNCPSESNFSFEVTFVKKLPHYLFPSHLFQMRAALAHLPGLIDPLIIWSSGWQLFHGRGIGTRWSLRSLPIHDTLKYSWCIYSRDKAWGNEGLHNIIYSFCRTAVRKQLSSWATDQQLDGSRYACYF